MLLSPLRLLLDPSERLFVGFLVSAGLMALGLSLLRGEGGVRFFLRREWLLRWWTPSAKLDYQLLLAKAWLRPVLIAPVVVSAISVMALVAALLELGLGPSPRVGAPTWAVTGLYLVVAFAVDDLSRYLLHRAMHRWPRLWQLHQVHHSAEVLTPATLHRIHPLESLLYALRASLTTGLVGGVFYHVFHEQFGRLEWTGVNALGLVFNALGANLRHSHVYLAFGRRLEGWLISPAQHQIHHSLAPEHYDKNYGSFLAIWDRIGGTLARSQGRAQHARIAFGLPPGEANHSHTVFSALLGPISAAVWSGARGPEHEKAPDDCN